MTIKMKYNGSSYSSGKSLARAMERDLKQNIERQVRSAASINGLSVRKTHKGFEVLGSANKLDQFYRRLAR